MLGSAFPAQYSHKRRRSTTVLGGIFIKYLFQDLGTDLPCLPEACFCVSVDEKKKKGDSPKESRKRAASERKPEVKIEKRSTDKKPEVSKERASSEKKPEVKIERRSSDKKPEVSKERASSEKKPEVSKERVPSEKKPEVPKEKVPSENKPKNSPAEKKPEVTPIEKKAEMPMERRHSDKKPEVVRPIMGVKPFSLPRDRATTDTGLRPVAAQPRDRATTGDQATKPIAEEPAPAPAPVTAKKPPKFGIGIGGAAGGGLLAEIKLRQERAASLGRVS